MNYVIFKNKCSKDIPGLLICELPPITKPKMRTTITKIDGKDGDIIDKLGYESYSKSMSIGLIRNFDVNKIIDYFNGEGDLIFSNEPDKVYKAQILDQINYERLIRFKKATVKLYVQPYKYLLNEPPFMLSVVDENEIKVANKGIEESKPVITIYGSGNIKVAVNGYDVFTINIDDEFVIIDSLNQEAYKDKDLKNRFMTGDFPVLKPGINTISWIGSVTKIIIEPKSRWV